MAKLHSIVTRVHRVAALLFLLAVVPAAIASARGGGPAFLVYLPLVFLAALALTGVYQLVAPWVRRVRAKSA